MRCKDVQKALEQSFAGELPARVREHLGGCQECREYGRRWRLALASFQALKTEDIPEPSLGFSRRVLRRLEEVADQSRSSVEYLEQAGRRFVYAAVVLTFAVLLSLILPSWGPIRAQAQQDLFPVQTNDTLAAGSDPMFLPDIQENSGTHSFQVGGQNGEGQR